MKKTKRTANLYFGERRGIEIKRADPSGETESESIEGVAVKLT